MTIRRRLTLGYIAIAFLIGIAGTMALRLSQSLERNAEAASRETAVRTMRSVDQAIFYRIEQLQAQARKSDIAETARVSGEEFDEIDNLELFLEKIDEDWKLGRETPEIERALNNDLSTTLLGLSRFYEKDYGFPIYSEIFVTNKHGAIIASSGQASDYLQSDETWYTEALLREDYWVGELGRNLSSGFYTLEIAVRLEDSEGHFVGVMKATLNLQEILQVLQNALPTTQDRLLASYLISSEKQLIFALDSEGNALEGTEFGDLELPFPEEALTAANGLWPAPQNDLTLYAHESSRGFRHFPGLGWACVLKLDVKASIGAARMQRNLMFGVHAGAFTLAILIGFLVARSVSRPLSGLEAATRAIGKGRLETRIPITSDDEIGQLASSFNQMLGELHDAHLDLRRRERLATLGELSGSVAHEIRNPLGVIKNSIYMLRHRLPPSDVLGHRQLDRIEKQVGAANRIISELLDFTRDPTRIVERIALQPICGRVLAELEIPDFIETIERLDGDPLEIIVDPNQVGRILDNLLRNAVQAMPDGGVLSLICERRGEWAVASVRDSGIGIAKADLDQIFEPLFTRKAKGIGLGLSLSQRYARTNGGRIECESVPGRGTTFRLYLPLINSS